MPDTERQDTLSEIVVREAIDRGMESPMRDTIVEAVEEAEGGSRLRTLPMAGALVSAGVAIGYLAGLRSREADVDLEDLETPEVVSETIAETADEGSETDDSGGGGGGLVRIAVVAAAAIAGVAIARRLRSSGEEWEPIDEFETAVGEDGETDEKTEEGETEAVDEGESEAGEEIEEVEEGEGTEE